MPRELPPGIYEDRAGFRVAARANGGREDGRIQPKAGESRAHCLQRAIAFLEEARTSLRKRRPAAAVTGTLAADVARYSQLVSAMPTFAQRTQHLDFWLAELGPTTPRREVTAEQINAVLNRWRLRYAAATCNKRRSALMHLWSKLDGKGASNPVRSVRKYRPADPLPRGRDPFVLDAALKRAVRCRSRAVCRVLLWTGMRPDELDRAERDDLDLAHKVVIARTGKGGKTRTIPLTPQAVSAWREFQAAAAWHDVPKAAPLNRWLKKATGLDIRVYDLRHSYGTALARRQTRLDVIASLMGHSTMELTKRYTLAAVEPDALAATAKLSARLYTPPPDNRPDNRKGRKAVVSRGVRRVGKRKS